MNAVARQMKASLDQRDEAKAAAVALRAAIADPTTMGERSVAHIDLSRPRRGEWWETWSNLPGFTRINGSRFIHRLLPGWEYSRAEIIAEMIPDLDALAEHGVQPTKATR
jgi:hypothetical protein